MFALLGIQQGRRLDRRLGEDGLMAKGGNNPRPFYPLIPSPAGQYEEDDEAPFTTKTSPISLKTTAGVIFLLISPPPSILCPFPCVFGGANANVHYTKVNIGKRGKYYDEDSAERTPLQCPNVPMAILGYMKICVKIVRKGMYWEEVF
jgi:hypothetical protein